MPDDAHRKSRQAEFRGKTIAPYQYHLTLPLSSSRLSRIGFRSAPEPDTRSPRSRGRRLGSRQLHGLRPARCWTVRSTRHHLTTTSENSHVVLVREGPREGQRRRAAKTSQGTYHEARWGCRRRPPRDDQGKHGFAPRSLYPLTRRKQADELSKILSQMKQVLQGTHGASPPVHAVRTPLPLTVWQNLNRVPTRSTN
jgi:hypothetical protein